MSNKFHSKFKQLEQYFVSGSTRQITWREKQLRQLKRMLVEHQQSFTNALFEDLGKSEMESWVAEIGFTINEIEHTLRHFKKWSKPRKVPTPLIAQPAKSYIYSEPKGVVLVIGAWNYPLQLLLGPLIAAIAAGNCAVLKPSELAVHTEQLLAELIPQYLDEQAFMLVLGGAEQTTELLTLPFAHIFYTGGEAVGKIVMRAASEHLTPVTLELGGKSPCIVDKNVNLDVTAARIVWSKWMNAGQTCVAPDYVLVTKEFVEPLIQAIRHKLSEFYGPRIQQSKDYGRIINQRHFERLMTYLDGQNIVAGGGSDADSLYIEPTIILNPELSSSVMEQEIFGPILPIIVLDDIHQSIPFINAKAKPLALYIYTNNTKLSDQILASSSAGNVAINEGMMFMANPNLPFGGIGNSGMGSYHGKFGFDTFSHAKSVLKRGFLLDVALRYPPFSGFKLSMFKRLF